MQKRVCDCVLATTLLRQRAKVLTRLRVFLVANHRFGARDGEVSDQTVRQVAEELLLQANDAEQQAEALLSRQVVVRQRRAVQRVGGKGAQQE